MDNGPKTPNTTVISEANTTPVVDMGKIGEKTMGVVLSGSPTDIVEGGMKALGENLVDGYEAIQKAREECAKGVA